MYGFTDLVSGSAFRNSKDFVCKQMKKTVIYIPTKYLNAN